jgi:hypothetical protein
MPANQFMLERIARAIALAHGGRDWQAYTQSARAAVLALREPTTDMLEAALPDTPDFGYLPEEWTAMIDHVASERVN